jgi:hypothetical protein
LLGTAFLLASAALVARSEALNSRYGLGATSSPTLVTQKPVVSPGATFDWADFGIGAAAMLGLLLLTCGLIVGSRYGRRLPRAGIS